MTSPKSSDDGDRPPDVKWALEQMNLWSSAAHQAREERDFLRRSLERYGRHDSGCEAGAPFFPGRCVCGLHKALSFYREMASLDAS